MEEAVRRARLRDECLNQHWFLSLDEARAVTEAWRDDYNRVRPHGALGNQAPFEFTQLRQLLQSDVGLAAPVLKELVGDVLIEARIAEGEAKPQMFARFTINALPVLAAIGRGPDAACDYGPQTLWRSLGEDLASNAGAMPGSLIEIVVHLKRPGGKEDHGSQDDEA